MDENWICVGELSELEKNLPSEHNLNGESVLIFHNDNNWYAYSLRCPHKGGAMHKQDIKGTKLLCPLHAWVFDLADDGRELHDYGDIPQYTTRIEEGRLFIEL